MSSSIAARQIHRQMMLQPRLALPAGRTVSFAEGRRLAKLVAEEEEKVEAVTSAAAHPSHPEALHSSKSAAVSLEENVSKRILLLRQKQNKEANVRAAVAYANRRHVKSSIQPQDAQKMQQVADRMMRGSGSSSQDASLLKKRRERGERTRKERPAGSKRKS